MAILTFKVDTDQIFSGEDYRDHVSFEQLFTDGLRKSIMDELKGRLNSEEFKVFSERTAETIEGDVKERMKRFLEEEITLTERWGNRTFVGSVEDLIKSRFDSVLLKPVDGNGRELQGCSSGTVTWVEWMLGKQVNYGVKSIIDNAAKIIIQTVKKQVDDKLVEMKDGAIKAQVGAAFSGILNK